MDDMLKDPLFYKMRNVILAILFALAAIGLLWAFGYLSWVAAALVIAGSVGGALISNRKL